MSGLHTSHNRFETMISSKQVKFAAVPIIYSSDNTSSTTGQVPFSLSDSAVPLESCLKFPDEPRINLRTEFRENDNHFSLLGIIILLICLFGLFILIYYSIHMLLQVEIEKQVSQTAPRVTNPNI